VVEDLRNLGALIGSKLGITGRGRRTEAVAVGEGTPA
jgi:hypothetical protein